ncbi:uncharacterized protein METZ01_LOCUS210621, partial [marine metagenome]
VPSSRPGSLVPGGDGGKSRTRVRKPEPAHAHSRRRLGTRDRQALPQLTRQYPPHRPRHEPRRRRGGDRPLRHRNRWSGVFGGVHQLACFDPGGRRGVRHDGQRPAAFLRL